MATTAERQKAFRENMKQQGFAQVTGWVPAHLAAEVQLAMQLLRDHPHLEIGALRDSETGKFVRFL